MKRAAIYARFSSERQNERSCQDQIELCSAWAASQGYLVVASYDDQAVSGASTVNRLGLGRMMRDARERAFDVVICEALDRLSRDQADLANIRKQLNFLEIGISTVQDGVVGAMHIGLKGLMGEMFLADLAQKTHRGLRARVNAGASGGGRSYGYELVAGQVGALQVVESEAAVVRRVFSEYLAGRTPRQIVGGLNAEGIPGPRGGKWNASTINGSRERQNGILQNRLYAGEIVWNRQRFIKDPSTGKRVSRPNPESEWIRQPVPQLAILGRDLFDAAQERKAERGAVHPSHSRKPKHLLSGLVKCGCCGAGYTVLYRDRLGCSGVRERGDCTNRTIVARVEVEQRVLQALHTRLAAPELVAEYVRTYHEERRALAAQNRSTRHDRQRRLDDLTRQIDRALDLLLSDHAPDGLMLRIKGMEAEAKALKAGLTAIDAVDQPITMHPAAAGKYARIVADLQKHVEGMKAGEPAERVITEVRKLIDRIVIEPGESRKPATITVYGLLSDLLLASKGAPLMQGNVGCGDAQQAIPCIVFAA